MNRLIVVFLLTFLNCISFAQDLHGRYDPYMDDEDIADQIRREKFEFTNFEYGSIAVGTILLIIGWMLMRNNTNQKKEAGCFSGILMLLGIILISPFIIGVLAVVDKLVYYGLIAGAIGVGAWIIISFFRKDKN